MAVDRSLWASSFRILLPNWPCPACGKGLYALKDDKLYFEETGPSRNEHDHDAWDPDWIVQRFIAFLECSRQACQEVASACGTSKVDHWQADFDEYITENVLSVACITPSPIPIELPETTPAPVADAIARASTLIWSSDEAAANQLRQAVEAMMDDLGIPATDEKKPIMLHNRILKFQETDQENGDLLLATKWLGNTGSHIGGLTRDHVLDAFDMIEVVLESKYETKKAELLAKATAVNAAKGPADYLAS